MDGNGKDFKAAAALSLMLGWLGVHRFYTGYTGIGLLQLFTLGGCGIWSVIDCICICFNQYKCADGSPLQDYDKKFGMILYFIGLFVWVGLRVLSIFIPNEIYI